MSDSPAPDPAESAEEHRERMKAVKAAQDARVRSNAEHRGVVVVHTGDGKGKSTAAFGVALRAAGHGQRVAVVQFIKGKWKTGEQEALKRFPEITHVVSGDGFTWETQDRAQDIASAERGWETARGFITGGEYDVVILDELNLALHYGLLAVAPVVQVLRDKPDPVSVIVTGRSAPQELIAVADTVSEARLIKHAFEAGIRARKGVEF